MKKVFVKISQKFTGKPLLSESLFNKFAGLKPFEGSSLNIRSELGDDPLCILNQFCCTFFIA